MVQFIWKKENIGKVEWRTLGIGRLLQVFWDQSRSKLPNGRGIIIVGERIKVF